MLRWSVQGHAPHCSLKTAANDRGTVLGPRPCPSLCSLSLLKTACQGHGDGVICLASGVESNYFFFCTSFDFLTFLAYVFLLLLNTWNSVTEILPQIYSDGHIVPLTESDFKPKGYLPLSGSILCIFWLLASEEIVLVASSEQKPGLLFSVLQYARQSPTGENHLVQNVSDCKIE